MPADDTFEKIIARWREQYKDQPSEFAELVLSMARSVASGADEQEVELAALRKENSGLKKVVEDALRVVVELNNTLNTLANAHAESTFLKVPCHCESHRKANEVLTNVALWLHANKTAGLFETPHGTRRD